MIQPSKSPRTDSVKISITKVLTKQPLIKHYIIINQHQANKSSGEKAIEYGGLIVNVILAFVAIRVYFLTRRQTKAAEDALETTIKTNEYNNHLQQMTITNTNRQNIERNGIENERIELENTPFLQIQDFKLLYTGTIIDFITFKIHNLGKYPIKIIKDRSNIMVEIEDESSEILYDAEKHSIALQKVKPKPVGQYVTHDNPMEVKQVFHFETDASTFSPPSDNHSMIFVSGEVFYTNLYNNKDMVYKYVIFVYYLESSRFSFFVNENDEIVNPNKP